MIEIGTSDGLHWITSFIAVGIGVDGASCHIWALESWYKWEWGEITVKLNHDDIVSFRLSLVVCCYNYSLYMWVEHDEVIK